MRYETAVAHCRSRLMAGSVVFLFAFGVIGVKLVETGLLRPEKPVASASADTKAAAGVLPVRADIVDRNGEVLATDLSTASLYVKPKEIRDQREDAANLARVLPGLGVKELTKKLSEKRGFVWIKRNLTPKEQYEVNALGIPGLYFQVEQRRVYPYKELFSHVVGYVGVDNKGLSGAEKSLEPMLEKQASPLALSLDMRVQHVLRDEISRAMKEFNAIGGSGLVMDATNGEIVGMVSLPDFDPHFPTADAKTRFNRNSLGVYEMGSTFKAFTTAMALDSGKANIFSGYDATRPLEYANFKIHDSHPENRWLTVAEIFKHSSNIGTARMALQQGTEKQKEFLRKLGLMEPVDIELPEKASPLYPAEWKELSTITISFGHGMSVSPLHVVRGVSAMVNGGVLLPLTLVKGANGEVGKGDRVISEKTSDMMRRLFRLVVEDGTGSKAKAVGYVVGGKTGTAEKVGAGGYNRKALMSSFVCAFPMHAPRYVMLVMLDEPKGNASTYGYATGGWTAAPTASRVIGRIAPMLGVKPVDENDPQLTKLLELPASQAVPSEKVAAKTDRPMQRGIKLVSY
ncbi:MAG: penicillin-binding protein 2 [Alphaproteobacteria bacterium]|nr:penicillin-binding protein 2 [Alphaproteobacteria bacterium]